MKKSIFIIVLLVIVGGGAWYMTRSSSSPYGDLSNYPPTQSAENPTSVVKVNETTSLYKNEELGFSVKYSSKWNTEPSISGIQFNIPVDEKTTTLSKLQANIDVVAGACQFPQVTTTTEKDTIKVGEATFKMISMSASNQGMKYFNRMYSTPKESVCYMFSFASITKNPDNKGLSATDLTKMNNANKAAVTVADNAFRDMVKSFEFVIGEAGENEALHSSATTTKK